MTIKIDADFPGGNIVVEKIEDDIVYLHQDIRDTMEEWFYWCFRIRDAGGEKLQFQFTQSRAIGVRGPAISLDGGEKWAWLGTEDARSNRFEYSFPTDADDVRFSFAMPYQLSRWNRFLDDLNAGDFISRHTMCQTEKGRDAEYIIAGNSDIEPRYKIAITARHHCCEMMADYTIEGLLEWLVGGASIESEWLRENAAFFIVPLVDLDGVEDGDQGKSRHPRDHGRDYLGESIYSTTGAIRRILPEWGGARLRVGLDLHCPHISGKNNETIYLVGSPNQNVAAEQRRFSGMLEKVATGPLPFIAGHFLPFGTDWNTGANYDGGKGFSRWVAEQPGIALGTGIEIPYANADGAEVNQETAALFGHDLGAAIASCLRILYH